MASESGTSGAWLQLQKQLGLTPSGAVEEQAVIEAVKDAMKIMSRQRAAWDVSKSLAQQQDFASLLEAAIQGIATTFAIDKSNVQIFLASPLEEAPIDVSNEQGLLAYEKALESYQQMLDDAGTIDMPDCDVEVCDDGQADCGVGSVTPRSADLSQDVTLNNTTAAGSTSQQDSPLPTATSSVLPQESPSLMKSPSTTSSGVMHRIPSLNSKQSSVGMHTLVYHEMSNEEKTVVVGSLGRRVSTATPDTASVARTAVTSSSGYGRVAMQSRVTTPSDGPTGLINASTSSAVETVPVSIWEETDKVGYIEARFLAGSTGLTPAAVSAKLAEKVMQTHTPIYLKSKTNDTKPVVHDIKMNNHHEGIVKAVRPASPLLPALPKTARKSTTDAIPWAQPVANNTSNTSNSEHFRMPQLQPGGRLPRVSVSGSSAAVLALQREAALSSPPLSSPALPSPPLIRPPLSAERSAQTESTHSIITVDVSKQCSLATMTEGTPTRVAANSPAFGSPALRHQVSDAYSVAHVIDSEENVFNAPGSIAVHQEDNVPIPLISPPSLDASRRQSLRDGALVMSPTGPPEKMEWLAVSIPASQSTSNLTTGAILVSATPDNSDAFSWKDASILEMVAVSVSQAKKRIQQMQAALAAQRRAFGLVEMVKAVSHELETSDIISRIIGVAYDLLHAERVSVFRVDRERKELVLALSQDAAGFRLPMDKGIVGSVAMSGNAVNIPDAYANPLFDKSFDAKTGFVTRNILAMPVKDPDGQVVAVIQAINKKTGAVFTGEDVRTLSVVADTAGVTLHKATLLLEAKAAKEASAALADVVRIANDVSLDEVDSLTSRLMAVAYRLVAAQRITLFLVDELKNELFCQESQDAAGLRSIRIPVGEGIAGSVARDGLVVNIEDAYEDARFNRAMDTKTGFRTRSILCIPVTSRRRNKTVAVIQAINKVGGVFTRADEVLLDAFSTEVGGLIDKISLQLAYDRVLTDDSESGNGVMSSLLNQYIREEGAGVGAASMRTSRFGSKQHSAEDNRGSPKVRAASVSTASPGVAVPEIRSAAVTQPSVEVSAPTPAPQTSRGPPPVVAIAPSSPDPHQRQLAAQSPTPQAQHSPAKALTAGSDMSACSVKRPSLHVVPLPGREKVACRPSNWEFDVLNYTDDELVPYFLDMLQLTGSISAFNLDLHVLREFVEGVRGRYRANPYHNFKHGMSVAHLSVVVLLNASVSNTVLQPIDKLATVMCAICHDVDHPGVTNAFESYSISPLAVLYNDVSVLEMHHAAEMFTLLRAADRKPRNVGEAMALNIGEDSLSVLGLSRSDFAHFRKMAIAGILATDMTHHSNLIEIARTFGPENASTITGKNMIELIVHSADLCNPVLPAFRSVHKWADLVCQEFSNQVALERAHGMPVTTHMDGLTSLTAISKLQCGFIDYVVSPLWQAMVHMLPDISCAGSNMARNRGLWKQLQDGVITVEDACKNDPPSIDLPIMCEDGHSLAEETLVTADGASGMLLTVDPTADAGAQGDVPLGTLVETTATHQDGVTDVSNEQPEVVVPTQTAVHTEAATTTVPHATDVATAMEDTHLVSCDGPDVHHHDPDSTTDSHRDAVTAPEHTSGATDRDAAAPIELQHVHSPPSLDGGAPLGAVSDPVGGRLSPSADTATDAAVLQPTVAQTTT